MNASTKITLKKLQRKITRIKEDNFLYGYGLAQQDPVLMEPEHFRRLRTRYIELIKQCKRKGKIVVYINKAWVWCGKGNRRDWIVPQN